METQAGKTALITGATSGIGRELANLFAKDGYNLVLVARSDENLLQLADDYEQQYGIKTTLISKDLAAPNAAQEIYDETRNSGLTINVLVNNAGFGEYGKFATETDLQKETDVIQVNTTALVSLTKRYVRDMVLRNEGRILMLGSVASVLPNPLMAVYGATKAFVYSFSEALQNELKDTDVSLTILMPGATDTDFFNKAGAMNTVAQEQAKSVDPAGVAKDGYDALMAGKPKVVSGLMNKAQVAMANLMPDELVTGNVRKLMEDRNAPEDDSKTTQHIAVAIGVAAAVVAGFYLTYRNMSVIDKAMYGVKGALAKRAVQHKFDDTLSVVSDTVKGAYNALKPKAEESVPV
jgi:uncharacterized protein